VTYAGVNVGDFSADMLVEGRILIEDKAVHLRCTAHEVQLVHYLTATRIETRLLFNFGAESLQFKRKSRTYSPKAKIGDAMDGAASAGGSTNPV